MTDSPNIEGVLTPDTLAAQGQTLRRLAARLLGDEHQAEDAVQEAWLTALQSPPRRQGALAWLRVVTQNVSLTMHRSRERRRRRELSVALNEALPATDEVVARGDLLQTVAGAVMSLSEPYRSTILMRYYEGLETAQVAKIHGVSPATVRSRVHRAIGQLRDRLDSDRTWGERRWVRALAPLVGLPSSVHLSPQAATGSGLSLAGISAVASVVVIGAALGTWWGVTRSEDPTPVMAATAPVDHAELDQSDREHEVERTPVDDAPLRREHDPAEFGPASMSPYRLTGLVVDELRHPIANARVEYRLGPGVLPQVRRTDADGRFEIVDREPFAEIVARASGIGSSGLYGVTFVEREADLVLTLSGGGADVHGRVEDRAGNPIPDTLIRIGERSWQFGLETVGADDLATRASPAAVIASGSDGRFVAEGIPSGHHRVLAYTPGMSPWFGSVDVSADAGEPLRIVLEMGATVHGLISDEMGRPVDGAQLVLSPSDPLCRLSLSSNADGTYEFSGLPTGRFRLAAMTRSTFSDSIFVEVRPGERRQWDPVLVRGSRLRIRVQDTEGNGLAGWQVEADWSWLSAGERPNDLRARLFKQTRRLTDADGWIDASHPLTNMSARVRLVGPYQHWPVDLAVVEVPLVNEKPVILTVADPDPPAFDVEFSIADSRGQTAVPQQVFLLHLESERWTEPPVLALGEGRYQVGPLPGGEYAVFLAFAQHGQAALAEWDLSGTPGTRSLGHLELPTVGSLEIDWVGAEAPPRLIQVRPLTANSASPAPATTLGIQEGRGTTRLFPGRYLLEVASGRTLTPVDFHIRSGEVTRLRAAFQQADEQ